MANINRSWAIPQLQNNPALLQRMADMVKGEVGLGRDPTLERIQLETAFNRAQSRNIPLDQALLSVRDNPRQGYYASDTYSRPASPQQVDYFKNQILAPVMQGSNTGQEVLGFTPTGNASGSFAANRAANGVYGNSKWYKPGSEMFVTEKPDMQWAGNPATTQYASNAPVTPDSTPMGSIPEPPSPFNAQPGPANYGHSPEAVAAAQGQGTWNIPQGQNLNGQPWQFPATTPMPTEPPGAPPSTPFSDRFGYPQASGLPTQGPNLPGFDNASLGLMSPGSAFPSPMTIANLPTNNPASLVPGPVVNGPTAIASNDSGVLNNQPQQQASNTPDISGLLGGIGGGNQLAGLVDALQNAQQPMQPIQTPNMVKPQMNLAPLQAFLQRMQQPANWHPGGAWTTV